MKTIRIIKIFGSIVTLSFLVQPTLIRAFSDELPTTPPPADSGTGDPDQAHYKKWKSDREQARETAPTVPNRKNKKLEKNEEIKGKGKPALTERQLAPKNWMGELTPQQRKEWNDFRIRTRSLTPAQRRVEMEKIPWLKAKLEERTRALRAQKEAGKPGVKPNEEAMKKMKEIREEMSRKSPQERKAFLESHPEIRARMESRGGGESHPPLSGLRQKLGNLSPEDRNLLREFREKAASMNPEDRLKAAQQLPIFKDLKPEESRVLQARLDSIHRMGEPDRQKLMDNFERWKKLSPEEQEKMRQRFRDRQSASTSAAADDGAVTP